MHPIFQQIEALLKQNSNLTQTRDSLLPRLISGKLSVENQDIQFPPGMAAQGRPVGYHLNNIALFSTVSTVFVDILC